MTDRVETWIVDRIEEGRAVIERALHETIALPLALLPAGVREGDALRVTVRADDAGSAVTIVRDEAETGRRAADAQRLLDAVKRTDPGGDITL